MINICHKFIKTCSFRETLSIPCTLPAARTLILPNQHNCLSQSDIEHTHLDIQYIQYRSSICQWECNESGNVLICVWSLNQRTLQVLYFISKFKNLLCHFQTFKPCHVIRCFCFMFIGCYFRCVQGPEFMLFPLHSFRPRSLLKSFGCKIFWYIQLYTVGIVYLRSFQSVGPHIVKIQCTVTKVRKCFVFVMSDEYLL